MIILYFGIYKPSYPRNKIIIDGLRENGVEVFECRTRPGLGWQFRLLFKYLSFVIHHSLARRSLGEGGSFDIMLVGFPGQEVMFLARLICWKPIVFDVFTSHYMGYILDRKYFSPTGWRAKYYRFMDRWSCKLADLVFLDTQAHIDYFTKEFQLPARKFFRVFLGAKSDVFKPLPPHKMDGRSLESNEGRFKAIFWGNFIPLQGVEYIIRAADILRDKPVDFYLIGRGQMLEASKVLAVKLDTRNLHFVDRISDEELIKYMDKSDICLSTFSGTLKADITIQNKIFETIASRRPVLTSRTTALKELFEDGVNCLLCNPADPKDLADKILMLMNNPALRERIAEAGYRLFRERLTEKRLGEDLMLSILSKK